MKNFYSEIPKSGKFALVAGAGCFAANLLTEFFPTQNEPSDGLLQTLFQVAVWSMFLCFGMAASIVIAQNRMLHKPFMDSSQAKTLLLGALVGGGIAGIVAQGFYSLSYATIAQSFPTLHNVVARAVAWGFMGCITAQGMTRYIANLNKKWAVLGGFIGGVLGAIGALVVWSFSGQMAGRLLGVFILGGCVGSMVGFVEVFCRKAWLAVFYSANESTKINLGESQVSFGAAKSDTVYVRGASEYALAFKLVNGVVMCKEQGRKRACVPGERITLGKVVIEVCSNATGKHS